MNRLVISILTFMFSFSVFAISDEDKRFLEIVDSEWQRSIDENPLFASYMGDKSSNQDCASPLSRNCSESHGLSVVMIAIRCSDYSPKPCDTTLGAAVPSHQL